ncbi:MAG: hypothetical protein KAT68_05575, partial [Bacteroidales bacterium]|nr:hypothetical protein [Bacteroidales bacterium]
GNVRATFTKDNDSDGKPDLLSYSDYYPGGMLMPGRQFVAGTGQYRFGYQGQFAEKDQETGFNHFELRNYDTRICRWMAPDPYGQYYSPYLGMGNNPVSGVDPDGGWLSPIFDILGNFLGTDSEGYTGDILIFDDPSKFTQGMDHAEAMKIGTVFNNIGLSTNAMDKIFSHVLSRVEFPDGSMMPDFIAKYTDMYNANGRYGGIENKKHLMKYDFGDYEYTVENISVTAVHEIWGHGIKKWGDKTKTHRKCYFAEVNSKYWNGTTLRFKNYTLKTMGKYNKIETGNASFPNMFIHNEYVKYYPFK